MGGWRMGLQSADRDWQAFAPCLLGPHRICLRRAIHFAETQRGHTNGNVWSTRDIRCNDGTGGDAQPVSEVEAAGAGVFSRGGADVSGRATETAFVPASYFWGLGLD